MDTKDIPYLVWELFHWCGAPEAAKRVWIQPFVAHLAATWTGPWSEPFAQLADAVGVSLPTREATEENDQ